MSAPRKSPFDTMTDEEARRFQEAMADPKFAELFAEYAREISDPGARRESELYLEQLERQQCLPADCKLIKPSPFFCVKLVGDDGAKAFANVCTSELIDTPAVRKCQGGANWNIPYSCSSPRPSTLPSGRACRVVDVTFHDQIVKLCRNQRFRDLIVQTSIDAVQRLLDVKFTHPHRVLTNCKCKDGPPAIMRIGGGEHPPADIPPMMSALVDNQATKGNERRNAAPNETDLLPAADGAGMNEADAEAPVALMSPEYHIVYQGDFQMADCTVTTPIVASTRPKSLLVRIALPRIARLSDHKDVALDVSPRQVTMSIPGIYAPVSIRLPFECDHEKGRARFQPRDRTLTITLPVVPSAEELVAIKRPSIAADSEADADQDGAVDANAAGDHAGGDASDVTVDEIPQDPAGVSGVVAEPAGTATPPVSIPVPVANGNVDASCPGPVRAPSAVDIRVASHEAARGETDTRREARSDDDAPPFKAAPADDVVAGPAPPATKENVHAGGPQTGTYAGARVAPDPSAPGRQRRRGLSNSMRFALD
ncbi:unnamed protein product (mitochondrion) [Plasmodiophora brassicae]|uniref:PIH1 domain-containing protein 1 n=1 Tax=Plasmodiophora brassicae TaxID=37360 RepID=A0A3P3YF02_PLABS|nr:unnamed protein product [Plasmodiophora brassicae]